MKKLTLFLTVFLFITCNKYEIVPYEEVVQSNYNTAFVNSFGNPSLDQDWGFGDCILPFTRAAQPNSNQWGTHDDNDKYIDWSKPTDITPEEREAVLKVFNQKEEGPQTVEFNFEKFFVQQVYCGLNGSKMNELACQTDMIVKSWWPLEYQHTGNYTDDIVNNFNEGKYNGNSEQGCMLMWFSSTSQWSFKTSQSGGQRIYDHWRMEKINDNYYIGFDYEAWRQAPVNANEEDKRDYIYNDWIIKIIPGNNSIPNRYTVRIIAEDLSVTQSTDFDFNDVVFDASYQEGVDSTFITLLAAGGTLPLYIEGNEIHQKFNVPTSVMVNTGLHFEDPVKFSLKGIIAPWDIEITVDKQGVRIPLSAVTGNPASKIAVKPSFEWCSEREDIRIKYPNFKNYVQDTSVKWY